MGTGLYCFQCRWQAAQSLEGPADSLSKITVPTACCSQPMDTLIITPSPQHWGQGSPYEGLSSVFGAGSNSGQVGVPS